ncbi:MAG TPA: hypothetical protein VJ772_05700 [Nitrososphaeraceae archaeon]|nr:hypothetical protein [Nitrososphaeraceae archaeon]
MALDSVPTVNDRYWDPTIQRADLKGECGKPTILQDDCEAERILNKCNYAHDIGKNGICVKTDKI